MRRIAVVDAPSNLGLRPPTATSVPGCAKAPGSLRDSGLLARLGARDAGCITPPRYDPAGWQPGDGVAQADEIAVFVRRLADRIGAVLASGDFPVVLGGDCSILLGAGLAMRRYSADLAGRVGLVYVDGHSDFRHEGNASYVGAAAGEALALATGRGQSNLASIEQRRPYFRDVDVVLLGIRTHDEYRLDLQAAGIVARAVPELRSHGAARSAQWARDQLRDCAGFWVHVDVDVLDPAVMPAVDAPDVGGIAYRELEILLSGLVCDPRCVGVQVTVFDPDYDPDGQYAREVTDVLVAGLEPLVTSSALAAADLTPVVSAPPLQAPPAPPAPPVASVPVAPVPVEPVPAAVSSSVPPEEPADELADEPITAPVGDAAADGVVDSADLDAEWAAGPVGEELTDPVAVLAEDAEGGPAADLPAAVFPDADFVDEPPAALPTDPTGDDQPAEPVGDLAGEPVDDLAEDPAHDVAADLAAEVEPASPDVAGAAGDEDAAGDEAATGGADLELPPVAWVDVRTGAVVDLAADRGTGRAAAGRTETPRLPAYSRGAVIGITTRKPIDLDTVESAPPADGGWVTVGSGAGVPEEPGEPAGTGQGPDAGAADEGAEDGGGALPFGRPGRKSRRAPRLALTLAPISGPPVSGRLARRADPHDSAPGNASAQEREGVVPFVPAQSRTPREPVEPPESPLTDVVPAARTPDEDRTPKQR
ncbi:arginase family protein [Dactylosporangium sp. NBC_01737]|uniref:arginase family protein n=1 Tax=Dactylosporangium sp. NBC_01737 TaxID=2975959 RepID=UPI002E15B282|nr:arginase family protein [Dactylosporangium sp. NBC_01737]